MNEKKFDEVEKKILEMEKYKKGTLLEGHTGSPAIPLSPGGPEGPWIPWRRKGERGQNTRKRSHTISLS